MGNMATQHDRGEFTLVVRKKHQRKKINSRKNAKIKQKHRTEQQNWIDCKVDLELLLCSLHNTLVEVRDTSFTRSVLNQLTASLTVLNSNGISEIICYGLGRFSQHKSPRYQLALLLYLKEQYNARVHMYDPVFCSEEVQALRSLNLEVIEINEEGKRVIHDKTTTLLYMPHCSGQLMNNFLYANWGDRLSNCILFSNSLTEIDYTCSQRNIMDTEFKYIIRIQPYVTEFKLENTFLYEEVFNSLSIHTFTKQDLLQVPPDFWNFRENPEYVMDEIIN